MPLPLILGAAAAMAAIAGVGTAVNGGIKMKEANDTIESANRRHKRNIIKFEEQSKKTNLDMDNLGTLELEILKSFERFTELFERIHNKPEFKPYDKNNATLPQYNKENLKEVSIGAGVLLGGLGGAAVGTAGGFAAAGATTAAVMALGTASTGTAIATLSGVAATNATLAALGGGALAAGGGGMALGTTILGAATLGVGLLVGGLIFNAVGSSLSGKADEAWNQMERAEKEISKICEYMLNLSECSLKYQNHLLKVKNIYFNHLEKLSVMVEQEGKCDWNYFTYDDRKTTENTVLLVGLLFKMCKVNIVIQSENKKEMNQINNEEIQKMLVESDTVLVSENLMNS